MKDPRACYVAGFDPDTGGTEGGSAVAICTTRRVLAVGVCLTEGRTAMHAAKHQRKNLRAILRRACSIGELDMVGVEVPMDYGQKRFARPADLMRLSLISGAAAIVFDEYCKKVEWVEPYKWKGQRPKAVDQRNTLTYFGWPFTCRAVGSIPKVTEIPEDVTLLSEVPQRSMEDVVDAMGIALYCLHREGAAGRR